MGGVLLFFCMSALALPALGAEKLCVTLLVGTNQTEPPPVPESVRAQAAQMKKLFGYNRFDVIGEKSARIPESRETWLVPSEELFLKVYVPSMPESGTDTYSVDLELYQRKKRIIRSKVDMVPGKPLYIKGPQWGKGTLILHLIFR
jgi:hypothetical protein